MRPVAAYSLTRATTGDSTGAFDEYRDVVEQWLRTKGATDVGVGQRGVIYPTGTVAQLQLDQITSDYGALHSFTLTEPVEAGQFETYLELAHDGSTIVLFCQLRTGSAGSALAPVPFDARCPGVVRDLIRLGGWKSGTSGASAGHVTRIGREAGRQLTRAIWEAERGLPTVVVSELEGFTLEPTIARDLARDLTGLATVAQIDDEAAWLLSEEKGREWSCYSGAIRLYWPLGATRDDPYAHRLWTQSELFRGGVDSLTAARRVQGRLHRMIFGQSAFQTTPPLITQIREHHVAAQRKQAKDADDYVALAGDYERETRELKRHLEERDVLIGELGEQVEDLKAQNRELSFSRQWTQDSAVPVQSEPDLAPSTVEDAVLRAMDECENLTFGNHVERGIAGLAPDAGPPMKILRYLHDLDALAAQLRQGPLGTANQQWLRERGIEVSGESPTIRRSPALMGKRTWDDGAGNSREFESHLKPSDSTSPDRCVRIYFDYVKPLGKIIVAWVGRHPE